jgi:hypothetical protein
MAALFLGCGAVCSDRLKRRYQTRKQDKKEYESRFEEFKAENLRYEAWRQSYRNGSYTSEHSNPASPSTTQPTQITPNADSIANPPSYDDVAVARGGGSVSTTASSRSNSIRSDVSSISRNERAMPLPVERPQIQRSTTIVSARRVAERHMAASSW